VVAGKARVTRIPAWVCKERATPPDTAKCSCPVGWRPFLSLVALLLGRRSLRICFLVDALPKPKIDSHAASPIYEMAPSNCVDFRLGLVLERECCLGAMKPSELSLTAKLRRAAGRPEAFRGLRTRLRSSAESLPQLRTVRNIDGTRGIEFVDTCSAGGVSLSLSFVSAESSSSLVSDGGATARNSSSCNLS
jgi:hypothetical protein